MFHQKGRSWSLDRSDVRHEELQVQKHRLKEKNKVRVLQHAEYKLAMEKAKHGAWFAYDFVVSKHLYIIRVAYFKNVFYKHKLQCKYKLFCRNAILVVNLNKIGFTFQQHDLIIWRDKKKHIKNINYSVNFYVKVNQRLTLRKSHESRNHLRKLDNLLDDGGEAVGSLDPELFMTQVFVVEDLWNILRTIR